MLTKSILILLVQKEHYFSHELAVVLAQCQRALNLYLAWGHPALVGLLRLYPNPTLGFVMIPWCVAVNLLKRTIPWMQPDLADLWNTFYEEACIRRQ